MKTITPKVTEKIIARTKAYDIVRLVLDPLAHTENRKHKDDILLVILGGHASIMISNRETRAWPGDSARVMAGERWSATNLASSQMILLAVSTPKHGVNQRDYVPVKRGPFRFDGRNCYDSKTGWKINEAKGVVGERLDTLAHYLPGRGKAPEIVDVYSVGDDIMYVRRSPDAAR